MTEVLNEIDEPKKTDEIDVADEPEQTEQAQDAVGTDQEDATDVQSEENANLKADDTEDQPQEADWETKQESIEETS